MGAPDNPAVSLKTAEVIAESVAASSAAEKQILPLFSELARIEDAARARSLMRLSHTPEQAAFDRAQAEREIRGKLLKALSDDLGPRYARRVATLAGFERYHRNQEAVVARMVVVEKELTERTKAGRGLIWFGGVGTGKDHLMASMLYAACDRHLLDARWVNGQELFGAFRDRIDTGKADEAHFKQLERPQILGISDPTPPANEPSAWDLSNLYRLIDRRYRAMRPTWITMNAKSVEDADSRLSDPVFDRLRDGAEIFHCSWPSYRERAR